MKRSIINLFIFFSLLILVAVDSSGCCQENKSIAGLNKAEVCEQERFDTFFALFSTEASIQQQLTELPLQKLIILADVEPEPKTKVIFLEKGQVSFPVYPTAGAIKEQSLTVHLSQIGREARVTLSKPDTDYLVYYIFHFRECWRLVRIENWSL